MRLIKKRDITMIIGDFKAKIGCGVEEDEAGAFGLDTRNNRGDGRLQFCRHRGKTSQESNWVHSIRPDFIESVKTYPEAEFYPYNNPVHIEIRFKRFLKVERE